MVEGGPQGEAGFETHPEDSRALHERLARSHGARAEERRHRGGNLASPTSTFECSSGSDCCVRKSRWPILQRVHVKGRIFHFFDSDSVDGL